MATKVKLMKFLQEMRGFTELGRRQFASKPSPLYLLQLRSHLNETSRSRRRLIVTVDLRDTENIPHPVKITHLTPAADVDLDSPAL